MKHSRIAALAVAVAALAVPASAFGHGSVYTDTATIDTDPDPGEYTAGTQTRHLVTNHGNTILLRESNTLTSVGMVDYSVLPGDLRAGMTNPQKRAAGDTEAQPHATCDAAALETDSAIDGWQGADPFYNYVPFQKAAAGLDDDPATWIPHVRTLTGADLSTVSDDPATAATELEALCEDPSGLNGTFYPADATQSTKAALAEGVALPLEEHIAELETQKAEADTRAATAEQENAILTSEIGKLNLQNTPLTISGLPKQSRTALAKDGAKVELKGAAGHLVRLTLQIGAKQRKALKLRSNVISRGKTTIGDDGTGEVTMKLGSRARKAVSKMKGSLAVTAEAVTAAGGDSAKQTLAR